jgi:hypothetical protein
MKMQERPLVLRSQFVEVEMYRCSVYRCSFNVESSGADPNLADPAAEVCLAPFFRFRFTGGAEFGGRFFPFERFPFAPVASITPRIQ